MVIHGYRCRVVFWTIAEMMLLGVTIMPSDVHADNPQAPTAATTAYGIAAVYPQRGHLRAQFRIFHWWENLDHYSTTNHNFVADIAIDPARRSEKEGRARIGKLVRVADEGIHDTSKFYPIVGSDGIVQVTNTWLKTDTVFLCGRAHDAPEVICRFGARPGDPKIGAVAVARDGSSVLIARADEVRFGDPQNWSQSHREEGPLLDVRRELAVERGNTGTWFLTGDKRYVVIVPSQSIERYSSGVYSEGGVSTTKPSISGVQFDFDNDAVVYDRTSKTISKCPKMLKNAELMDAEDVNGQLQLVYLKTDYTVQTPEIPELHRVDLITIADTSGHALYEHQTTTLNSYVLYAGWDPAERQLWFRVRDVKYQSLDDYIPTESPDADYHFICWNAANNTQLEWRLKVSEIKEAIAPADSPSGK